MIPLSPPIYPHEASSSQRLAPNASATSKWDTPRSFIEREKDKEHHLHAVGGKEKPFGELEGPVWEDVALEKEILERAFLKGHFRKWLSLIKALAWIQNDLNVNWVGKEGLNIQDGIYLFDLKKKERVRRKIVQGCLSVDLCPSKDNPSPSD